MAFAPGAALALVVLVVIELLAGASRGRGLTLVAIAAVAAAVLLFPFVPTLIAGGGAAFTSTIGTTDLSMLGAARPRPGTGDVGGGPLPAGRRRRVLRAGGRRVPWLERSERPSWRSPAWACRGCRPPAGCRGASSNPLAYLALASVGEALLVALRSRLVVHGPGPGVVRAAPGGLGHAGARAGGRAAAPERRGHGRRLGRGRARADPGGVGRRGRLGEGRLPRVVGRGRRRHAVPGPRRRCPGDGGGGRGDVAVRDHGSDRRDRRSTRAGRWRVPAPTTSRMP